MRIIKLTSLNTKAPVFINIECIGHFSEVKETTTYGKVNKIKHTRVGVLTHNNGGFEVIESTDKIIELINESRGI